MRVKYGASICGMACPSTPHFQEYYPNGRAAFLHAPPLESGNWIKMQILSTPGGIVRPATNTEITRNCTRARHHSVGWLFSSNFVQTCISRMGGSLLWGRRVLSRLESNNKVDTHFYLQQLNRSWLEVLLLDTFLLNLLHILKQHVFYFLPEICA